MLPLRLAPPSTSNLWRFCLCPRSRSKPQLAETVEMSGRVHCRRCRVLPCSNNGFVTVVSPSRQSRRVETTAGFSDPAQVAAVPRALRSLALGATQPRILTRSGGGSSLPPSACTSTIIPVATIIDDVVCRTRKCLFLGSMSGMYAALRRSSPAPPNPLMLPRYGHCL